MKSKKFSNEFVWGARWQFVGRPPYPFLARSLQYVLLDIMLIMPTNRALNTSRASVTSRGSDLIVLIEAGGFCSWIYGNRGHINMTTLRQANIATLNVSVN